MNHINNNIFTSFYPTIDIHGESAATADLLIKEFINDNFLLKNETIIIIHGKGMGILKKLVHEICSKNKQVLKYKLDPDNLGSTIITIKIDK